MFARSGRSFLEAALFLIALGLGGAAALRSSRSQTISDTLYFGAWCAGMLLIFSLGLRLPLFPKGRFAPVAIVGVVVAAIGLTLLGNIALYRRDAHFDATVSERFTAPPELETIARSLQHDVLMTYFFNSKDEYADAAKQVLAVEAREHPHLKVRVLDLDTELVAARDYAVKLYNTVVVEAQGRRTQVENTVDLRQMAYAIERVLKQRTTTVCFITGHGERYTPGHVHLSHRETLGGEEPGGSGVLEAPPDGLDRLKLAIATIGYDDRAIEPGTLVVIPQDCAVVADLGPRSAYAPAEVRLLKDYLIRGGRVLLAYDPPFQVAPELALLLGEVGLAVENGTVVDPLNHYGADQEQAAVPYYPPHPITEQVALTVFPGARPIRLRGPVAGTTAAELIATSKDSYVRPLNSTAPAPDPVAQAAGPRLLAAEVHGTWPSGGSAPFRLVLVGSASFAANAFFPYASNGDLGVSMIRWLADDTATPLLKPASYSPPEMRLTHRQMQVTFLLVEVLLPLSVMLFGAVVWWRRR
jgi:gliding motility-associatede transport system auxiliary component